MARVKKDIADMHKSPFPVALRALMSEKPATTQEKLAEITGKTRQTVSQYVNGISEPGYDTLIKIADYFDVSVDYLLGRTNDRGLIPSVYDTIGLSEESVRFLQLAKSATSDSNKLKEFADALQERNVIKPTFKYPELYEFDDSQILLQRMAELSAKAYAKSLAAFIDDLISIASSDRKLIRAYSQIICPDTRPVGLEGVIPESDYIRFQVYEISTAINNHLVEMLEDFEVTDHGND